MTELNNQPSGGPCDLCDEVGKKILSDISAENMEYITRLAEKNGKTPGQLLTNLITFVRDMVTGVTPPLETKELRQPAEAEDAAKLILEDARALSNSLRILINMPSGNVIRARECYETALQIISRCEQLIPPPAGGTDDTRK